MKHIKSLLIFLLVCCMSLSVQAENSDRIIDRAGLLTEQEENDLERQFAKIAETYRMDLAVLTTDTCGGQNPETYTEDYYYQNQYGYGDTRDGVILMINMGERDWCISARGKGEEVFTDYGRQKIADQFMEELKAGEYQKVFQIFGKTAEQFMQEAEKGKPYDTNHHYKKPMSTGVRLLISVAAGLVAALAVFGVLKGQLKTVGTKYEARDYVKKGSFHVTRSRDIFLYRNVHRRKIEHETVSGGGSSSHTTSDGGSAGSTSGKF